MTIAALTASGHLASGQFKQAFDPTTGAFAAFNALLKEFYLPGVLDIINSKRVLSRYLRRNTRDVMGRDIHTAINTRGNMSPQYITERAQLPDPGQQQYRQATYTTKNHYARILFSGQAASSSRGGRGSFLQLMNGEVTGVARDMQVNDNRVLFGNGTGRYARVSAAVALSGGDTVIPVADPGGITSQGNGCQFFEEGQRLCISINNAGQEDAVAVGRMVDASFRHDGGGNGTTVVVAVDTAAGTILVDGDWTAAVLTNDFIYRVTEHPLTTVVDARTNRGHEMNGLAAICSETDPPLQRPDGAGGNPDESAGLGNLTPTDATPTFGTYEPRWAAYAVHAGGVPQPFAESMFQDVIDGMDQLGDGSPGVFFTTHGVRRSYAAILTEAKRFVNTKELPGGFRALTYNDVPIVVDKDCSRGRAYALDLDVIELAYENDYHWLDKDGSVLSRLDDFDAYQATLARYSELICRARNRLGVIRDIQDS